MASRKRPKKKIKYIENLRATFADRLNRTTNKHPFRRTSCGTGATFPRQMSRNPLAERAAVATTSLPAFLPSIIATAIISLAVGYWVGVGNSVLPFSRHRRRHRRSSPVPSKEGESSASENSSEDETDSPAPLHDFYENSTEECKMARSRALRSSSDLLGRCS